MLSNKVRFPSRIGAFLAAGLVSLAACTDSTGPDVDAEGALRSLSMGLSTFSGPGTVLLAPMDLSAAASYLDQAVVTINGSSQTMYAMGMRQTFPAGTCMETLFIIPDLPAVPGECTPPPLGMALVFWQTRSSRARPDRILVIAGDVGANNFNFMDAIAAGSTSLPGFAMYLEGHDKLWFSQSGTLNADVAKTGETCSIPLPPFAKSAVCNVAAFSPTGEITFEDADFYGPGGATLTISISQQTVRGIWQEITETKPYAFPSGFPSAVWLTPAR